MTVITSKVIEKNLLIQVDLIRRPKLGYLAKVLAGFRLDGHLVQNNVNGYRFNFDPVYLVCKKEEIYKEASH